MKRYIALLRGINVGGNKKIDMKTLKQVFISMGFTDVKTYINTGNVIFSTTRSHLILTSIIERSIKNEFGFDVPCVVISKEDWLNIEKHIPCAWENDAVQKTDVLFLWEKFDTSDSINLTKINREYDKLLYVSGAIIWNINRCFYSQSGMEKFIGTTIYKNMTARNVNTVRKISELL